MSYQRNAPGGGERPDDVDRIFARLRPVPPPPDLAARILRALPAEVPKAPARAAVPVGARRPDIIWRWVSVAAVVLLVIMSVWLGGQLEDSGSLSVLSEIFGDFSDFLSEPGGYLEALVASLPMLSLLATLAVLAVFWWSSSAAVDRASRSRSR